MLFGKRTATRRPAARTQFTARRTRRSTPPTRRLFVEQLEDRRVMTAAVIAALPVGSWPVGLAENPAVSRTYVANNLGGTVSVIDDATNTVLTTINLGAGSHPSTVGVDPSTNRVFVVRDNSAAADDSVAVIDGTPGSPTENTVVATIPVPGRYLAMANTMAVNPATHRVYIPSFDPGGQVVVVDGSSNTLLAPISVAANPLSAAYDSVHNRVYVGHGSFFGRSQLTIIDAATHAVSNGPNVGIGQYELGVNPGTNTLYVHKGDPSRGSPYGVAVVETVTNTVTTTIPGGASAFGGVGVDASTGRIYVADNTLDAVRIIDGAAGSPTQNTVIATVAIGDQPRGLGVNPALGRVYVATSGVNAVSVVADVHSETNRFRPAAPMLVDHGYTFTLTRLQDGRLLAVGGNPASGGITAAAEVYDPQTGAWSLTGSLNTPRDGHSATLLPDGRVLIAGGSNSTGTLASAELFDPQTATFSLVGSMAQARSGHTAILLDNGKLLVAAGGVGGAGDTFGLASAELYDPGTGTWTPTGSLNVARMNHAGTRLLDGRVLVAGGQDRGVTFQNFNSAEVYNPATGTWSLTTTPMITARRGGFSLTSLSSGQVLVAGGGTDWTGITTANAELFDPASSTWSATTPLPAALNSYSAMLLADGKVLIAGGNDHPAAFGSGTFVDTGYLFDPATELWSPTANRLTNIRANHRAAPLPDGSVLLAGGWNGTATVPSAEIFGVPNSPPLAQAGGPYSVPEAGSVQLDASGTTDADLPRDVLTYAWDLDGDGQYDDAVGPTPFFSAAALDGPTTVSVGLRVMDAARTSSTGMATIAVANVAPTVTTSGPDSGLVAKPYTFTFSATDPSAADMAAPFAYAINWGDGQTTTVSGPASGVTLGHVYADFGNYSITATATDKDGGTSLAAGHSFQIDTATSVVIDAGKFGLNEDNVIVVRREGDNVVVTVDGLVVLDTALAGLTGGLEILGAAGNDKLMVDQTGGFVTVPIAYDGGTNGAAPGDDLEVTGGTEITRIRYDMTGPGAGELFFNGNTTADVTFRNIEPVTVTSVGSPVTDVTINVDPTNAQSGANTVSLSDAAGTNMTVNATGPLTFESLTFSTPSNSLTVNGDNTDDDAITISSVDTELPFAASLTINGDGGNDTVNLNGDITFASGNNLDVDLTDDASAGDADSIIVGAGANLVLSGSGTATLKASRNVVLASGSSVEVVDGNLTVEANQQTTPTVGNFVGVDVDGGLLQSTGTGIVTVKGKGGSDSGGGQYGVYLHGGGEIAGGTSGTEVAGTGGANDSDAVVVGGPISAVGGGILIDGVKNASGLGADVVVDAPVTTTGGGDIEIRSDRHVRGGIFGDISSDGIVSDGNITITADGDDSDGSDGAGTIQLAGDISAGDGTVTFRLADCDGRLDGNVISAADLAKAGGGVLRLSGAANTYAGTTNVNAGTLLVNGTLTADTARVTVHAGATLGGTGTIGTTPGTREVVVENGGFLAPGDVDPSTCSSLAGRLTVNGDVALQAGSALRVQLGGMTAGVDYDQLRVNGAVNLSGSLGGAGGAVLETSFGYSAPWGTLWRIIDNDLADSIETRFQGLPDGAPVVPGVEISYRAGDDSNDVVLTAPGYFDFDGPVTAPGSVSVPLSLRYADTPGNDYGWSPAAPPLASFDRGLADALRSDGHYGYDGTFLVDVPVAGDYVVTPLIGDAAPFYHDWIEVTLEDAATPQLTFSTVAGQWGSPSLVVSSDMQLSLRLRNAGGVDPHYVINALRIRPRAAVSTLLIAPPSPGAALDADGITVDTYTGERAPAGSLVTVAATLGTVVAGDDQDPTIQGIQVRADEAGAFTFRILRPSGLNTNPETAVITAQEVEGRALGQGEQEFQSSQSGGDDPTVMRFDFNASATYTHTNPDFLPVGPRDLYSGTRGYGWSVRVAAVDRPNSGFSYLNRDLHTGSNALFQVQVETGKTYNVRVYLANPLGTGGYQYTYDNFDVIVEGGTTEHIDVLQPNAITILYLSGTDSNNDGILDIQFVDRGGQNFNWVVSGIEMSTGSFSTDTEIHLVTDTLPAASPAAGVAIDSGALAPVVTEAVARWSASRLTPAQAAILSDLHVGVSDLGGATLGVAYPTTRDVRIDDDAAGWGWSVIGDRSSVPGVDLLHVVMHEIGHLLGYGHSEDPDDLMAPVWSAGTLHPASRIPDLATRIPHPSSPVDAVFGDRGREGGDESGAELLESRDTAQLAAAVVRSSDEAAQARVPRRSGLQRYERELDDWFAQLAAVEDTMATDE